MRARGWAPTGSHGAAWLREFSGFPATLTIDYIGIDDGTGGWLETGPMEQPDGTTTMFTLIGWDGTDLPSVHRNGVLTDIAEVDADAGTITLNEAPQPNDELAIRYHVGDSPP